MSNATPYNLPSNSNKKKEGPAATEERTPKLQKAITGDIVQRKVPLGKRIAKTFTGDDSKTVGHFVLFEVILPAAKQMIVDAGSQGLERMFYGESGRGMRSANGGRPQYNAYNRVVPNGKTNDPRGISQKARASHDFREIIFETRGEAEKVSDDLSGHVEQYDSATVSDLYDLVGVTGTFQDDKWGWYDLRDTRIRRVKEGYLLELPRPQPIE